MALSMDEQRILAEIEQQLSRAEPVLAARLATFGRPGAGVMLRSRRARLLITLAAAVLLAVVSMVAYALVSLRGAPQRGVTGPATTPGHPAVSVPRGGSPRPAGAGGGVTAAPQK